MTLSSRTMTPLLVSFVFFMESIDSTIINTAIPTIARSLAVNPVDLKVALISYLLSLAMFIPISGWLADKYGAKRVFMSALLIFTVSSWFCGFAHSLLSLVIARFVQGLGGALGVPVGRLMIARIFGRARFIDMMSRILAIGASGMMIGPILGGVIVHYWSWQWIFWVNIPIGLLVLILSYFGLDEDEASIVVHPLDKVGFLLFGLSLGFVAFGLSALSETSFQMHTAVSIIGVAIVLFIAYCLRAHNSPNPVVQTDLLLLRTFKIAVLGNLLARLGLGGIPFLLPLMFQVGFGMSAELSGFLLAPLAAGVIVSKPFTLPILKKMGYRRFLILNTCIAGSCIALSCLIHAHTALYWIGTETFIYGIVLALQYGAMNSLAYAEIVPEKLSAAISIMALTQQLSQSFGVAAAALFLRLFSQHEETISLTARVFHHTFLSLCFCTLLSTLLFMRLKPEDGREML